MHGMPCDEAVLGRMRRSSFRQAVRYGNGVTVSEVMSSNESLILLMSVRRVSFSFMRWYRVA